MKGQEFAELSAFAEVARLGNFARAAASLNVVPSTLSQTIRSLEERLGVRLFNRTTRHVALTDAGAQLLARIRPALEELENAVDAINDFRDTPAGRLRLSLSSVPARLILAPAIRQFMIEYPAITLDIVVEDDASDLDAGFDAGIRYGAKIAKDMELVRIFPKSRIIAIAAPSYIASHQTPSTPQDLHQHNCLRFRIGQEIWPWEFARDGENIEIAAHGSLIANNIELLLQAVRDGAGITCMVEAYVADDIAAGRLVPLLGEWSPPWDDYYLYYSSRRQVPATVKALIQFMQKLYLP